MNLLLRVIAAIISILIVLCVSGYMFIIVSFAHNNLLMGIVAFNTLLLIVLIVLKAIKKIGFKTFAKVYAACLILMIAVGGINLYLDEQDRKVPIYRAYDNLNRYKPFTNDNALAVLNDVSAFTITDDLPRLDGATALYPVYAAFVQAVYPEKDYNYEKESEVLCTKTGSAYKRLADGETDIIFVAEPSKEQLEYVRSLGKDFELTPIGHEAFVFFVNASNRVNELTVDQIKDIYSGKVSNWKTVGGKNLGIKAFQRDNGSGSQTAFLKMMQGVTLQPAIEKDVIYGMGRIVTETADYKNYAGAIGFTFRYYVTSMMRDYTDEKRKDSAVKLLKLNGVAPTFENIANGTYPISSNFYAVTLKDNHNRNVKKFIEWIVSPQGQQLIEKTGYVPLQK